jgi:hypothetical protein
MASRHRLFQAEVKLRHDDRRQPDRTLRIVQQAIPHARGTATQKGNTDVRIEEAQRRLPVDGLGLRPFGRDEFFVADRPEKPIEVSRPFPFGSSLNDFSQPGGQRFSRFSRRRARFFFCLFVEVDSDLWHTVYVDLYVDQGKRALLRGSCIGFGYK